MRSVRPEIQYADIELCRFVVDQWKECTRLGYPKQAAFARLVSRGTVVITPPDDPVTAVVGRFYWSRTDTQRRVILERYAGKGSEKDRASEIPMSVSRFRIEVDRILSSLSGYLEATVAAVIDNRK